MLHFGAPTKRNLICHGKNSSWTLSQMPRQSSSWSQLPVKFESVQTSWAVRIPRWVSLLLLSSQQGLREVLNLCGGSYGVCRHRKPRKSRIWRWRLFSPRRSCCWAPSSSWMQICRKPLLSALAVDILPPIICHEGTRDSCSGFGVCRTRQLTQETDDLYWFGPLGSSNSLYIQSALAFALHWSLWSLLQGCP
jgi:hypothetical protein